MILNVNNLKAENEVLKRLLKDGNVLINYDSRDCDGCYSSKVVKFYNLEEIYKSIENENEWSDGSFSFSVPLMYPDGSLELNEYSNGGSW